jgi:hypothetical protein
MPNKSKSESSNKDFRAELRGRDHDLGQLPGWMFEGLLLVVASSEHSGSNNHSSSAPQPLSKSLKYRMQRASNIARFAGANVTADLNDEEATHVVVGEEVNIRAIREKISRYGYVSQITILRRLMEPYL